MLLLRIPGPKRHVLLSVVEHNPVLMAQLLRLAAFNSGWCCHVLLFNRCIQMGGCASGFVAMRQVRLWQTSSLPHLSHPCFWPLDDDPTGRLCGWLAAQASECETEGAQGHACQPMMWRERAAIPRLATTVRTSSYSACRSYCYVLRNNYRTPVHSTVVARAL